MHAHTVALGPTTAAETYSVNKTARFTTEAVLLTLVRFSCTQDPSRKASSFLLLLCPRDSAPLLALAAGRFAVVVPATKGAAETSNPPCIGGFCGRGFCLLISLDLLATSQASWVVSPATTRNLGSFFCIAGARHVVVLGGGRWTASWTMGFFFPPGGGRVYLIWTC